MSGPINSRFQPAMKNAASAQDLVRQADELRALAQVQAIRDREFERVALRNDFLTARDANHAASLALPGTLPERVRAFLNRWRFVTTVDRTLQSLVPYPLTADELASNPHLRQRDYRQATIETGLAAQQQIAAQAFDGADAEAQSIVDAAWAAAVPATPDRAMAGSVDATVDALRAALSPLAGNSAAANSTAQRILRAAIADGDTLLIYSLLGSPAAQRIMTIAGVSRTTLGRIYAESQIAAVEVDAHGIAKQGTDIAGGAFLRLQGTPQSLAALPGLARAYWDAQLAAAKALLQTSVVQSNLR